MIPWWKTSFGEEEFNRIAESFRNKNISQGKVTEEFEQKLSEFLGIKYVVATSSGSAALLLSLMAIGVRPGDEVIVPNRTWIATAHAPYLLGAKVVLVDVEENRPILDVSKIEEQISLKTKVIIPVHMNGRSVHMEQLNAIAKKYNLFVIEDAAQAIGSQNSSGYLGTQSDIGCFSLSVAKTIATGQGGFAVTNDQDLAYKLRAVRTHGVENVKDPKEWVIPGFNFRFTDILASIGIEQLKKLPERLEYLKEIYRTYLEGLKATSLDCIPVNIETGEVPVYTEYLVNDREDFIQNLSKAEIDSRPFYPDLDKASYFPQGNRDFPNSRKYGLKGIYLPSGPSQKIDSIKFVIEQIKNIYG
ncbi:DegT/DnrJ/EryC1/StrS family aminotransferase [Leptospira weilii]|uniref:DegT/DnrJ/EryC1/StrS aminotransferase family protein n=1 Tax=Leptospira weilii str. UI 13098 TaxID=1088542 RepID=M6QDI9_9LEPT|nr:DegT/DnrJ/EryC1/StrS family aminotransferase [Leptospira weilii]EMN90653.1 DegT/DnrJ/EryC1/StrS aminotransferase family protein [Leptospira weilii str. UI 13098]OMI16266.1 pyridoxal phosphate-dependent aminotransferase [Leptospira weilii serovar Heyan]ULH30102.1 DegT/DnrJ/EryC1/StrS family aminotransferase [Leptospira weilii]UPY78314.1 DegT/DnrJ/EryC1/StrS family aminotransferase [Leptospira weilii]